MNNIKANVPSEPIMYVNDEEYRIGDRVRILKVDRLAESIGYIHNIMNKAVIIYIGGCVQELRAYAFGEIGKIRHILVNEDLNTAPFFDDEEREFWRTHWMTRDGLKEKTPEDIAMLEELAEKYK